MLGAWDGGDFGRSLGDMLGGGLVAEHFQQLRRGSDEGDVVFFARSREGGIFGEEAVTGMDGVDAMLFGDGDDVGDVEIAAHRLAALRGADEVGLVRLEAVEGKAVFVRVDGDGAKPQFRGSAEYADGDLRAIGDEQFLHGGLWEIRVQIEKRAGYFGCHCRFLQVGIWVRTAALPPALA